MVRVRREVVRSPSEGTAAEGWDEAMSTYDSEPASVGSCTGCRIYGSICVSRETRHSGSWSHCAIMARAAFKHSI